MYENNMNILEFVCVNQFGFANKEYEKEIEERLCEIYKLKEARVIKNVLEIDFQAKTNLCKIFSTYDFGEFEYVGTVLKYDVEKILDVITIAVLSEEQINQISNGDLKFEHIRDLLKDAFDELPLLNLECEKKYKQISYIRPKNHFTPCDEVGKIDTKSCGSWIQENDNVFGKFEFNSYNIISILRTGHLGVYEDFLCSKTNSIRGPFTILNTGQFHKKILWRKRFDDSNLLCFLEEIKFIIDILRTYECLDYHMKKVSKVDKSTYDIINAKFDKMNMKRFWSEYKKYEKTKIDWVKLSSKTMDEIYDLKKITPYLKNEEIYTTGEFDVPIPMEYGFMLENAPNSMLYIMSENLMQLFEKITTDISRVSDKQNEITKFFHDKISIETMKLSTRHTVAMTIMTLVILFATIIMLINTVV